MDAVFRLIDASQACLSVCSMFISYAFFFIFKWFDSVHLIYTHSNKVCKRSLNSTFQHNEITEKNSLDVDYKVFEVFDVLDMFVYCIDSEETVIKILRIFFFWLSLYIEPCVVFSPFIE